MRHATGFLEKLFHMGVFGKHPLKKIVQDATGLKVKYESRLQHGMLCLAVDFDLQIHLL